VARMKLIAAAVAGALVATAIIVSTGLASGVE
jgi:hypothetical protein